MEGEKGIEESMAGANPPPSFLLPTHEEEMSVLAGAAEADDISRLSAAKVSSIVLSVLHS